MDFAKFVALISTGYLYFSRADRLGDPYEGSVPRANVGLRPKIYAEELRRAGSKFKGVLGKYDEYIDWSRQWTFVSCWHANWHESAAMWNLYARTDQAVAIRTQYQTLIQLLAPDFYVGEVSYIDYEKDWMPEGNSFYPFMHKRVSFAHEHEVRAICQNLPDSGDAKQIDMSAVNDGKGVPVRVELDQLIQSVFVAPACDHWFVEALRAVMDQFEIAAKIHPSSLSVPPYR